MFPLSKTFNESGSLSSDTTDNSQRNLLNIEKIEDTYVSVLIKY